MDEITKPLDGARADPRDALEIAQPSERTVPMPEGHDLRSSRRANAGKRGELLCTRGIQPDTKAGHTHPHGGHAARERHVSRDGLENSRTDPSHTIECLEGSERAVLLPIRDNAARE